MTAAKRMGRPPIRGPKTSEALLTVRVPAALKEKLMILARRKKEPLAVVVRRLVEAALEGKGGGA